MVIIDFNQIVIANIMQQVNYDKNAILDENLVRHMILNQIRNIVMKFKPNEFVIACDSKKYWRRDVFPYYKIHRKKERDESGFNWKAVFEILEKIKTELKSFSPYKVVEVEGAEADDIIATLVQDAWMSSNADIIIVSSDKDFFQLHSPKVKQWSPYHKKWLKAENPDLYLLEHILKGDKGDGVPNFLSVNESFVMGKRQTPVTKNKINDIIKKFPEYKNISEKIYDNPRSFLKEDDVYGFCRNYSLINLKYIPENIKSSIMESYIKAERASKSTFLNYFIEKRLKNLTSIIGDF